MNADELLAALQAALDETERIATTGSYGPYDSSSHPAWHSQLVPTRDPDTGLLQQRFAVVAGSHVRAFTHEVTPRIVTHIVHNDPERVLRRVAADRRVLARHRPIRVNVVGDGAARPGIGCAWCDARGHMLDPPPYVDGPTVFPCDDLRDLADRVGVTIQEAGYA